MKQNNSFFLLGITGGAGSGKSTVVEEIQHMVPTRFLHCDVIAHELMEPGKPSYVVLVNEFGESILEHGQISRQKLALRAMADAESRKRLNMLTHPLVRRELEQRIIKFNEEQFAGIVVLEAALLIEAGYEDLCDAIWYVYAPLSDRIRRMKENRGYSEEKIANILAGQMTEEEFMQYADVVIENPDGDALWQQEQLKKQIEGRLKVYLESRNKM